MAQKKRRRKDPLNKRIYRGMSREEAEAAEEAHRKRMAVLIVLFMTMFFGMVSNTMIGNAMPVIVSEIGGNQAQFAWIITSGMLANTITTPIAGKLADLLNKKWLFMSGIGLFMLGSLLCGIAWSPQSLIAFRVLQGMGMGLQITLSQVIMATVVPPRERGRYNGYMGAVFAVATVSGPLLGGVIVDVPFLGWRWTYWIVIPFMAIALWAVIRRLHTPRDLSRKVSVDYLGAALISVTAASVLLWISMVGRAFPVISWPSLALAGTALLAALLFGYVEGHVLEPLIPLTILLNRTTLLAIAANISLGTAMFGTNVYIGQYFQYGLGFSPTMAGLLGLPMVFGIVIASTWTGQQITRRGTWKEFVVAGMTILSIGFLGFWFVGATTPVWYTMVLLLFAGLGLGASNMNLLLAVQNSVGIANMGAATSAVTFFRTLFGAIGIQMLGFAYGLSVEQDAPGYSTSLDFTNLDAATETLVRAAYADAIAPTMLIIGVMALLGALAVFLMPSTTLRETVDINDDPNRPDE